MTKHPACFGMHYTAPSVRQVLLRAEVGLCTSPGDKDGELPAVEEEGAGLDEWRFW